MKKTSTFILLSALAATGSYAGVAEKKAQRAASEAVDLARVATQQACGNTQLEVAIAWDQVDSMIEKNAELIASKNSKAEWIYGEVGNRTVATLEALAKICGDDADYKEEIAKLTQVAVTPKEKYDDYASEFALNGTSLNVKNGFYMSRTASDFVSKLMELY